MSVGRWSPMQQNRKELYKTQEVFLKNLEAQEKVRKKMHE